MALSANEAITRFNVRLVQELPLDDAVFYAMAKSAGLFPLDHADSVQAQKTKADKVTYLLRNVVEPGADHYLPILLQVMKDSGVYNVVNLANEIEAAMAGRSNRPRVVHHSKEVKQPTTDEKERMRMAIQNGNTNALRRMLEDDCIDVNADISQPLFGMLSFIGLVWYYSPLHLAVKHNQIRCVKLLVEHGADINLLDCDYVNRSKRTPLERAVGNNFTEIVYYLYKECSQDISRFTPEYQSRIRNIVEKYSS